jgi:hypothetical protein
MNVQEVEARMVARINSLEEEETRLKEGLDCLRKLDGIAAEWNIDLTQKMNKEAVSTQVEEREVQEPPALVPAESLGAEQEARPAEDLLDQLRRKLVGKSEHRSKPVFNSRLLFGANA